MPSTEHTVAGVTLTKHRDADGYHCYRCTIHGAGVEIRPTLGANLKPIGWRAYELEPGPKCIGTGETLTLAVQRATYSLGMRARAKEKA